MANKKDYYRFRLTNGKTQGATQLPLKATLIKKVVDGKNMGLKKIAYVKGHDSIFVEDHTGDEQAENVWFEDGVLDVHKEDKALVAIVFGHRWYKTRYELIDEAATAVKKLDKYELIEKANAKLNVASEDELRANGIAILGGGVIEWDITRIKAGLKERAYTDAQGLIDKMNDSDYNAKFAASLALLKGIIVINPSRTGVTWADGKTIVKVPAGQDPMTKIAQFLSGNDEQAVITLQEIGERTTRAYNKKVEADVDGAFAKAEGKPKAEAVVEVDEAEKDLEEARALYEELYEKDVPPNMKNKIEWLQTKIEEAQAE